MRQPTPENEALARWRARLAGEPIAIIEDDIQPGFYKTRAYARGPFLPGRIWIVSEIDWSTGELLSDETFAAEIGDERWEATWAWIKLAKYPVTVAEWHWLRARAALHNNYRGTERLIYMSA